MLALRTARRCNSAFNKAFEKSQFLQIESICSLPHGLVESKNISLVHVRKPALASIYSTQRRTFASTSDEDVTGLERVYYGTLTPRMRAVKVFSLTTSIAGFAAQPILMEEGMKIGGTGMAVFLCGIAGFFTFVTPVLLHFITKKYVTEIHYNPATKEYVATTINIILQRVRTKFRPSDVKVPEVPGMFTSFELGKRGLFIDPALFEDPEHYVRIMGYDKPIDFKLDLKETTGPISEELNKTKK